MLMIFYPFFQLDFVENILPDMAAASAAVKLGSFVKEDAICSTKYCLTSGDSILDLEFLASSVLDLDFVRSRVTVGPDELSEAEQGTEPRVIQRLEPDVASI